MKYKMDIKFLNPGEFNKTKPLAAECFGASADLDDYYENDADSSRIAVLENDGQILSMVQLRRIMAVYDDHTIPVWYILYVCTSEKCRHKGYMDLVMNYVLESLKREGEAFTFLVPVDEDIYRHLGFVYSWKYNESEQDMLYADDGLDRCFACLLNAESFDAPVKLQPA